MDENRVMTNKELERYLLLKYQDVIREIKVTDDRVRIVPSGMVGPHVTDEVLVAIGGRKLDVSKDIDVVKEGDVPVGLSIDNL